MPQKRRIFIAVNLPEDIKRRLLDFQKKWEHLPVRWTKKSSLHLTVVFIGYADEQEIYEICRLTKEIVKKYEPFSIIFEKILYGPPALRPIRLALRVVSKVEPQVQGKAPRMIWLKGKASDEISKIKNELEEAFVSSENLKAFRIETRPFSLHITLARMNMGRWHSLEQKPELEQDFKAIVPVASIDVMESDLKRDGAEYTVLEVCLLRGR